MPNISLVRLNWNIPETDEWFNEFASVHGLTMVIGALVTNVSILSRLFFLIP